jgi:hypothetical protein
MVIFSAAPAVFAGIRWLCARPWRSGCVSDYRVIDLMARGPSRWKILGMNEKHLLKKVLRPVLPDQIVARRKQAYRAPIVRGLLAGASGEFAREMLTGGAMQRAALFDIGKVNKLLAKLQAVENPSEVDGMALAGILSSNHPSAVRRDYSPRRIPRSIILIGRSAYTAKAVVIVQAPPPKHDGHSTSLRTFPRGSDTVC